MNVTEKNNQFYSISRRIFEDSLNYCANFQIWDAGDVAGESVQKIVMQAIGDSITIGGTYPITHSEAMDEIQNGFFFTGSEGSHPNLPLLESKSYQLEIAEIIKELSNWLKHADQIIGFWLKDGHPFYPVFWDYAYIIEQGKRAYVFIGSSSD
jgi:hypothetical protein